MEDFSARLDMCVHVCVCSFSVMVLLHVAWREHNCEKEVWNGRCWVQPGLLSCLKESVGNTSKKFLQISHEHPTQGTGQHVTYCICRSVEGKKGGMGWLEEYKKKKKKCQKKCSILLENSKNVSCDTWI